jgi:hypothetical protein
MKEIFEDEVFKKLAVSLLMLVGGIVFVTARLAGHTVFDKERFSIPPLRAAKGIPWINSQHRQLSDITHRFV